MINESSYGEAISEGEANGELKRLRILSLKII